MKLIDRKALINQLKEENIPFNADINKIINIQPIAFDTEKVVEQLEQQAEQYRNSGFEYEKHGYSAMADKYYAKQCSYLHAIEIVRKGGVE